MPKLLLFALLLSLSAAHTCAQTTSTSSIPVTDKLGPVTFVGYSYMQADGMPPISTTASTASLGNSQFGDRSGLHGMVSETTWYLTRHFGVTADFSFNSRTRTFTTAGAGGVTTLQNSIGQRVINVLGGPQVRFPNQTRAVPFVRALFGVANTRFLVAAQQAVTGGFFTNSFDKSSTNFAMALGGGLDVQLNNRFGLRVIQIDYNPVFLGDQTVTVVGQGGAVQTQTLESKRQDNIRLGVGVTIR